MLEVRGRDEGQDPGRRIDREEQRVRPSGDRIEQSVAFAFRQVQRRKIADEGLVLGCGHGPGAIQRWPRSVENVRHIHGQARVGRQPPGVGDTDDDLVLTVSVSVCRRLEVGRDGEVQRAIHGVDRETAGIRAADDGIGQAGSFGVGIVHRRKVGYKGLTFGKSKGARTDKIGGQALLKYDPLLNPEGGVANPETVIGNSVFYDASEESGYLRGREIEYVARIAIDSQFRVPAGLELQQGELDIVPKSVGQTDPLDRIEGRGTRKELTGILHQQRIYPGTTVNADIVLIVNDYIISAACRNRIGTGAAIDEIVACIATDRVVSVRSQHVVAPGTAIDEFGRGGADMD